jgi:hypothetical protein
MTALLYVWLSIACLLPTDDQQVAPAAGPAIPDAVAIERILDRHEKRGDTIKTIRCNVQYREENRILFLEVEKTGEIALRITESNPRIFVHFKKCWSDGTGGKQEWYLFDGEWWHEGIERLRKVTSRQLVRPGERFDPFDIETAAFPLPFGQKKDKLLRNFDVALAAPAKGDPEQTDHLVFTPKPNTRLADKYDSIEFFIRRDNDLPARVVMTKKGGDEDITADFSDVKINGPVTGKEFDRPSAWKGYGELKEHLREPAREDGGS